MCSALPGGTRRSPAWLRARAGVPARRVPATRTESAAGRAVPEAQEARSVARTAQPQTGAPAAPERPGAPAVEAGPAHSAVAAAARLCRGTAAQAGAVGAP